MFNIHRSNNRVVVSIQADVEVGGWDKHCARSLKPLGELQDRLQKYADTLVTKSRRKVKSNEAVWLEWAKPVSLKSKAEKKALASQKTT